MIKTIMALVAGALLAAPAAAQSQDYVQSGGGSWRAEENAHGAVLRRGGATLYLGRSCDAWSPRWGRGRWGYANGGWLVAFPGRRIGFPRQEPPVRGTRCDVP
ncbi:MAG TPA: hypothetical protein VMG08_16400 [Allosphingosinicella sp.]|nr:hypothetical protein [Allosphingosinicella sp.]